MNTIIENEVSVVSEVFRDYHGGYFKVLLSPDQTNGAMAMIDITLPKGVEPPLHVHLNEDETFYLLEGDMSFRVGDNEIKAKPGDAVFGPRGVPHDFKIDDDQARFITVITPGDLLGYFMEFSTPTIGEPVVIPPSGPPPAEAIAYLLGRLKDQYGIGMP